MKLRVGTHSGTHDSSDDKRRTHTRYIRDKNDHDKNDHDKNDHDKNDKDEGGHADNSADLGEFVRYDMNCP